MPASHRNWKAISREIIIISSVCIIVCIVGFSLYQSVAECSSSHPIAAVGGTGGQLSFPERKR